MGKMNPWPNYQAKLLTNNAMPPYSCLWGIYYLLTYTASRTVITPTWPWEEELKVKLCICVTLRCGGRRIKDVSVHVPYFSVVANDVAKVPCLEI